MKAYIGVDADSGLTHTLVTTLAYGDLTRMHALLRGEEAHAFGDAGYTSVTKHDEYQGDEVT